MPIYEYACGKCGAHMEVMQKISDAPLKRHGGGCGGKLEKQMSRTSFQFKGSGWYVTDYAGKKAGGGGESKESAPAETKSEPAAADSASKPKKEDKSASTKKKTGGD